MKFLPKNAYHIFNQGNNQATIFHDDEDYTTFLNLIRQLMLPNCEILAWCLMPNHFHLMIYATEKSCNKIKQGGIEIEQLANGIRKMLSGYARIYNQKYNRTGSLFRQKTKSKALSEADANANRYNLADYIYNCFNYIHQNPVEAELVSSAEQWKFSSYLDYCCKRKGTLCRVFLKICNAV
ncbi:transposase [Niabella aquatica]